MRNKHRYQNKSQPGHNPEKKTDQQTVLTNYEPKLEQKKANKLLEEPKIDRKVK